MRLLESTDIFDQHRRTWWKAQQTFITPLKDLPRFGELILGALGEIERASVVFDLVVFSPRYNLAPLYAKYKLPPK